LPSHLTRRIGGENFETEGYKVLREHPVKGNGAVDILAKKPGESIAIEVETGKSEVKANLKKIKDGGFDQIVVLATSPDAINVCHKTIASTDKSYSTVVEMLSWLDIS